MKINKEIKVSSNKIKTSVNNNYREALDFTVLIYKLNPNTIFKITRKELCEKLHMDSRKVNRLIEAAEDFGMIQYDEKTHRMQRLKLSSSRNNFTLDPDKLTSFTACEHWVIKCILMEAFDFTKYVYHLFKFRYNPFLKGKRSKVHELHKQAKKILKYSSFINYNYFGHSYAWMAKKVGVSKSTIRTIIREMIEEGLVISKPNYKKIKTISTEITKAVVDFFNNEYECKGYFRKIKGELYIQFANYYDVLDTSILPKKNIFYED